MQNRTEELLKLKASAEKHLKEKQGKMNKEDVMQGLEMLSAAQCRFLIQNNSTPQTVAMVGRQMSDYQKFQKQQKKHEAVKTLCILGTLLCAGMGVKEFQKNQTTLLPIMGASAAIVTAVINKRTCEAKEINFESSIVHDITCHNKPLSSTLLQMKVPYCKYVPGSGYQR